MILIDFCVVIVLKKKASNITKIDIFLGTAKYETAAHATIESVDAARPTHILAIKCLDDVSEAERDEDFMLPSFDCSLLLLIKGEESSSKSKKLS